MALQRIGVARMFDWLTADPETLALVGTGLGTVAAAAVLGWRGVIKGRATPSAIEAAALVGLCKVGEAAPAMAKLTERIDELVEVIEEVRDLAIRIEDRTRRP